MSKGKKSTKKKGVEGQRTRPPVEEYIMEKVVDSQEVVVKVFGGGGIDGHSQIGKMERFGARSKQLPPDHFEQDIRAGNVIAPLYDPAVWAFLLEQNTRLNKLVNSMACNTVGLGWKIVPVKEDETYIEQNKKEIEAEKELLIPLFQHPNPEVPFTELMKMVKVDEESTGQGWMEVIRNLKGDKVANMNHLPSYTMRVAKGGDRFVQMRPSDTSKKVYFKPFGVERKLDSLTGEWEKPGQPIPADREANEVLYWKIYNPRSSFYGAPRVVSAAPAVAGTRLAHKRNVAFFENDATPRLAIIVNGGQLSDESMKMIEDFVDARGKGPGNAGRLMVLQARGADSMLADASQLNINLMPLTVGVQDDASFSRYLTQNNEEVREAFGIGQIFIGTSDDVNRAVALAMKQLTVEQVFEPESRRYEYRINETIVKTFNVKHVRLKFIRPRTTDMQAESQAYSMLAAVGGVTPNDVRDFLEKPRFEGKWANTPLSVLRSGMMEIQDNPDATMWTEYGDKIPQQELVDAQADKVRMEVGMAGAQATTPQKMPTEGATITPPGIMDRDKIKEAVRATPENREAAKEALKEFPAESIQESIDEMQAIAQGLRDMGFNVEVTLPE